MFYEWVNFYWRVYGFSSSKKVAAIIWEMSRAAATAIETGLGTSSRGLVRSSKADEMRCAANNTLLRLTRISIFAMSA